MRHPPAGRQMAEPAPWRVAEAIAQKHVLRLPEVCPHLIVRFQPGPTLLDLGAT